LRVYLGVDSGPLSQESSGDEPEAVGHRELILHDVRFCQTGMRVVPFVGRESGHDEKGEADQDIGGQHVDPNFCCQWIHETEQSGWLASWHLNKSLGFSNITVFITGKSKITIL
jgi:hypothetical protein